MAGIYIKWQEKMNLKKKVRTQQEAYKVQWNMVNVMKKWEVEWKINIFNKSWGIARVIRQGAGKDSVQQKKKEVTWNKW